jgi:glutamyl-tRNA synthetase
LGEDPKLKSKLKTLTPQIKKVVAEVNKMKLEDQKKALLKIDKHALDKKEEKRELPHIPDIKIGKCSFRLPPPPEKELHIGHALSYLLNNYYAKKYKGTLYLRFEDTNPEKCEQRFVDGNKEDLTALGITWDYEYYMSDNLNDYYTHCYKLLKKGSAYSCTCTPEMIKKNRENKNRCNCFEKNITLTLRDWNKMKYGTYREGACVIRLKGDLKSKNSVMWDPVLFRVNKTKHYRQGNKFNAWPVYDFTAAIEDAKITHVLRDANWTQRVELQDFIREKLEIKKHPVNVLYARYQIEGSVTQGRVIRKLVEEGVVSGFDDVRLATVKGLLRRGILPEALMELLIEVGITKSRTTIPMEKLYTINRRILDKKVNRYFFVKDPVLLIVKNAPKLEAKLPLSPYSNKTRKVGTNGRFFIPKRDALNGLIKLKYIYNVKIVKVEGDKAVGEYVEENITKNVPIIQWVAEDGVVETKILEGLPLYDKKGRLQENTLIIHEGVVEKAASELPLGTQIQFERFAFVKKEEDQWVLSHK